MKILYLVNVDWFFISHRLPIAQKALQRGYEVHLACTVTRHREFLEKEGLLFHEVPFGRSNQSVMVDIWTLFKLVKVVATVKPTLVHAITIKPVLYGGIISRLFRVQAFVAAISGLGFVFVSESMRTRLIRSIVCSLYKFALGASRLKVIFQNPADRNVLTQIVKLPTQSIAMIKGSGVNLKNYSFEPEPDSVIVTMASRLLKEKGVEEFVAAARLVNRHGVKAEFWLVGEPDEGNPNSVKPFQLEQWRKEGVVKLLGFRSDIPNVLSQSNIVVLPSYYGEGVPKVLLEAAACGRAVVTTDNPGCAEAVEDGVTGLVVPRRDAEGLAKAVDRLIGDVGLRKSMGQAGRKKAELEFDINRVVSEHIKIYDGLVSSS